MSNPNIIKSTWYRNIFSAWSGANGWRTDIPVSVLQSIDVTHAAFALENGNEVRVPMPDLRRVLRNSPTRFAGRIVGPFNVDHHRSMVNGMIVEMEVQEH